MENFNLVWCKMRAGRACKVLHVQKLPKYRIFSDFLQLWSNTAQRPIVCYFWNHACLLICNWTITMQKFNLIWCKMRAWRACKVLHVQKCENSSEFGSAITLRPFECQFWNLACIFITTRTNSVSNFEVIERKMLVKRARKVCTCVTLAIFTKLTIFIMGNPIICLLRNFTGYLRYTQASISLSHLENCAPLWLRGGQSFDPPRGFVVTYIHTYSGYRNEQIWKR